MEELSESPIVTQELNESPFLTQELYESPIVTQELNESPILTQELNQSNQEINYVNNNLISDLINDLTTGKVETGKVETGEVEIDQQNNVVRKSKVNILTNMYMRVRTFIINFIRRITNSQLFRYFASKSTFLFRTLIFISTFLIVLLKYVSLITIRSIYFGNILIDSLHFLSKNEKVNEDAIKLINNWVSYGGLVVITNVLDYFNNLLDMSVFNNIIELLKLLAYYKFLVSDDYKQIVNNSLVNLFYINKWSILKLQSFCLYIKDSIKVSCDQNHLDKLKNIFNKKNN